MMHTPHYNRIVLPAFTLIELMVSMGVIGILSTVLLANYPDTSVRIKLANETERLYLQMREAQVRGSAIDSFVDATSGASGYGIYVTKTDLNSPIFFRDLVSLSDPAGSLGVPLGDGIYTPNANPGLDETQTKLTLPGGYEVMQACAYQGANPGICYSNTLQRLDVSFTRPKVAANITINGVSSVTYDTACISLHSLINGTQAPYQKSVIVEHIGRISMRNGPCP